MGSIREASDYLYEVEFTFHRATNLPIADINNLSADPYIVARLSVPHHPIHDERRPLAYRTPTCRKTRHPEWNVTWRVSGIPSSGFDLKLLIKDEDPGDQDDRLGRVRIKATQLTPQFKINEMEHSIQKHRGSIRAYTITYVASALFRNISKHGRVVVSIKVLGKAKDQTDPRVFTLGPHWWSIHYSPLIGRIVGTKSAKIRSQDRSVEPTKVISTFQATKLQLGGPVPAELDHRYVGNRKFIAHLFARSGILGPFFNYAVHGQHTIIYYYSGSTEYGVIETDTREGEGFVNETVEERLSRLFCEMCQWGEGGRLYTYVITLDAEWRFCETGEGLAIDFLSKHSMHSDLAIEVAYSGEFYLRSLGGLDAPADTDFEQPDEQHNSDARPSNHVQGPAAEPPQNKRIKHRRPQDYELVIDNSSGTYQPKEDLLPVLQRWLSGPGCFQGLGKVTAISAFDKEHIEAKKKRNEFRRSLARRTGKSSQKRVPLRSMSSRDAAKLRRTSSVSTSDAEDSTRRRTTERRLERQEEK